MDKTTAIVICVGLLVVAFIVVLLSYRTKGKGKIKGPWRMGVEIEGSNDNPAQPGANLENARTGGNARVIDSTGKGASGKNIDAEGDIEVSSSPPPKK